MPLPAREAKLKGILNENFFPVVVVVKDRGEKHGLKQVGKSFAGFRSIVSRTDFL